MKTWRSEPANALEKAFTERAKKVILGDTVADYAAYDAAAMLIDNWTTSISDGSPLAALPGFVDDIDGVVAALVEWKAEAKKLVAEVIDKKGELR